MNQPPQELHQIAPTLAELKKMPADQKDRLLLAKLAKMSRHDSNVLNKANLMLPGDPFNLTQGYPVTEKQQVKEHLLGAPWTRLVNEGYLVDLNGQGFHKVSAEGHDNLNQQPNPAVVVPVTRATKPLPDPVPGVPRVFISYSWDTPEHKAWVSALAERLQNDGIQVIIDRWNLKPGQNKLHVMEQAVATSDFVVIICTEKYAAKANARQGGVGYESIIITGEVAEDMLTDKFIPILRQGSFKTSLPKYLKGHLGVNLSEEPYSEEAYDELLRQLHGEPIVAPPIGKKPDFSRGSRRNAGDSSSGALAPVAPLAAATASVEQKPNAAAWARYDKPGQANSWISGIIRSWSTTRYSFEIVRGTEITDEEFFPTKDEVIARFLKFQRALIKDNYIRMNFSPGSDVAFRVLE